MPVYEFRCPSGCDSYEVWRSIAERQTDTDCPQCGAQGSRLYHPPMTLTGPLRLKREVAEPRLVRKDSPGSEAGGKPRLRASDSRPWMLNRGC